MAAVGEAADVLAGKDPEAIDVVHPLRDGVIADLDAATAMLQAFLRRTRLRRGVLRGLGGGLRAERRYLGGAPVARGRGGGAAAAVHSAAR